MSKYDNLKFLKETRARKSRVCDKCGHDIKDGEIYYKESVGRVNVIGMRLKGYCVQCNQEFGDKLLAE